MSEESESGERVSFLHGDDFEASRPSGALELGPMELSYQELFAEVLEDGVITADERARLDRAAENLGLRKERLDSLEDAMTAAYETHHRIRVIDQTLTPHASISPLVNAPPLSGPLEPAIASAPPPVSQPKSSTAELDSLRSENMVLRQRLAALEDELRKAQAAVNVEVDLSIFEFEAASAEDPDDVWRRVRQDPLDAAAYRALKDAYDSRSHADGKFLACQALVALRAANPEEAAFVERHRPRGLIAPLRSLDENVWRKCLFHPEDEPLTGSIFSVVAGAVLVGRVTTLRRDGLLHRPDPESLQDSKTSTVMAARAVSWAAAILGLPVPRVYAEPQVHAGYVHAAGMPPFTVLGAQVLTGRSIPELAFAVGRHLSGYRGEHFVRTLFSATEDLEDLFLAALLIANPKLPIKGAKAARIQPLARAIEPLLEAPQVDALRGHYMRFAEEGGRTNLMRWSSAVEKSAARVGLALNQDLVSALDLLEQEEGKNGPLALDLLTYSTSGRFAELRTSLGIALATE